MFKKLISRVILLDNNPTPYRSRSSTNNLHSVGITHEAYDSPCHQTSQQQLQQTSNNIDQLQSQHSLEYSNRIRLQRDARLNRKTMLLQKRHEVEDITENMTILDDSVQIEYPAIFDIAENTGLNMTDDELKNLCLIEIEKILNSNTRSLRDYQSMPYPEMSHI
ncbi:hypothetical protein Ahy_A07g035300 [Arachis hypogaea]|uniref:Uncharacterized protein n=1 Tax=Arachis hypogaea TaxID=3818 RepID=A0A445CDI4_ARAHY|nr:hypothetical protein Ahy_A07g035300 [Arachis hypogaea]